MCGKEGSLIAGRHASDAGVSDSTSIAWITKVLFRNSRGFREYRDVEYDGHTTAHRNHPNCKKYAIVHYDTSAMKRCLTSVSLQHEPKASDVITLVKKTFVRTTIVRNFISRGVKMRIFAREACVKPHLRTRSDIKIFTHRLRFTKISLTWRLYL